MIKNTFNHYKTFTIAVCLICFTLKTSFAQKLTNTPYSSYGIGDINSKSFANNYAMGGTCIAMQNDTLPMLFINGGNPASYASNRLTTVEMGLNLSFTQLQKNALKQKTNAGNIGYLALVFPIVKWWGTGVMLKPYSITGYNISQHEDLNTIGSVDYSFEGSGSVNQVSWGNAIKPFYWVSKTFIKSKKYKALRQEKNDSTIAKILQRRKRWESFSIGFNASYIFGTIAKSESSIFPQGGFGFNSRANSIMRVDGFSVDYGAQYAYSIDSVKNRKLTEPVKLLFGATFNTQTSLRTNSDLLSYSYFNNYLNQEVIKDTIQNEQGLKGKTSIPLSYGLGLGFKKGSRWLVSGDYSVQNWSAYNANASNTVYKNSMRISIGAQLIPDKNGKYLQKVNYRLGARYAQTMLVINSSQVLEKAVTFGFGLPIGQSRLMQSFAMVNLSAEIGIRGTTSSNLVKEQFLRIVIGFTMNDKWFIKPKFD